MSASRLDTALDRGLTLPAAPVQVLGPSADYDLSLTPDQAFIVATFRPDVLAWEARGYRVVQSPEPSDATLVVVPRSKALARDLVARAGSGLVLVDGQRTDGIDSIFKACRAELGDLPSITKAHGRLFWFEGADFSAWQAPPPSKGPEGFYTAPGVFSDGAIDAGSRLLAEALPDKLPRRMADLGAGWGYLSSRALEKTGIDSIDLIEAEAVALDCARLNVTDPRASFLWEDATTFTPKEAYDGILCNPPFHTGRAPDSALGQAFIATAARALTSRGQLWLVANRHLPYEAALRESFAEVAETGGDNRYKIFHASRPRR
ncbi:class I SAM-dependent methyltransferase [Pelagovum pacificum]|uniref:Class I SAM-dependent methyltransferase n=1 Tax=Pelagovum pacificum TaxID=2588711 RepID=A0A5C5GA77_9RHOB|nr:class I SAM-dependent methyltransferase [Pelagovum pacificum]QQA42487.1 class I SAM-dependent methyltransferase [Pelagovum pacificum]TNY31571.1 class I SAM-dependent methyltransferase [Pelagovum pacificum]